MTVFCQQGQVFRIPFQERMYIKLSRLTITRVEIETTLKSWQENKSKLSNFTVSKRILKNEEQNLDTYYQTHNDMLELSLKVFVELAHEVKC